VAKKGRIRNLLVLLAVGAGLIPIAVLGLFAYKTATKKPLHASPDSLPSEIRANPKPEWAGAVSRAQAAARAGLVEQNLPGISVAVGAGGEVVWAEGFGWADLEQKVRVAPDTRFRIGTASIALTSAAAGLLIEQGKLKLDDEIQTYVPELPKKQWPVTLRQLMGHVAGVRNDGGDEGPLLSTACEKTGEGVKIYAGSPLRFEPGTHYWFSSYGWILVSAAIEAVSDQPIAGFMRDRVFDPLEMRDTKFESEPNSIANLATSYFPSFAEDNRYGPDLMRPIHLSCFAGAGGFASTSSDLVRFAMAVTSGKLLKPETVRLLQTPVRLPSGETTGYGLGWDLESATILGKPSGVVGHDGNLLGSRAVSFMTLPEYGIVVAVLSNTSHADTFDIAVKIAQAFAVRR
jgi:CubicO group peptidase (beta-lactamase class C family)